MYKFLALQLMIFPAFCHAMDLCALIEATEARVEMKAVQEDFSFSAANNQGEPLRLEAFANECVLSVGEKSYSVSARLSPHEFALLKRRFAERKDDYWAKNSENRRQLETLVRGTVMEYAFYGPKPKPIRATRELVDYILRHSQSGGRKLKVEIKTDGVLTSLEQVKSLSKWANTMHEIVERRLTAEVAEGVARERQRLEDQKTEQQNKDLLDKVLGVEKREQPASLEQALYETAKDPNACEITISGFLDAVENSPLRVRIERYQGRLQIRFHTSTYTYTSLAAAVEGISNYAKGHWRPNERVSSEPFGR